MKRSHSVLSRGLAGHATHFKNCCSPTSVASGRMMMLAVALAPSPGKALAVSRFTEWNEWMASP
jgi:hypothetical protein